MRAEQLCCYNTLKHLWNLTLVAFGRSKSYWEIDVVPLFAGRRMTEIYFAHRNYSAKGTFWNFMSKCYGVNGIHEFSSRLRVRLIVILHMITCHSNNLGQS